MVLEYGSQIHKAVDSATASSSSVRDSDKSKPYIPRAGVATDGWSKENEASATCFCGAVQLAFVSGLHTLTFRRESMVSSLPNVLTYLSQRSLQAL